MPTPADTTITITHSKTHTTTTTPKDGPDLIAILTLIIPVLTFIAGYFGNRWYEQLKEKERLKDVKKYFLTLSDTLAAGTQKQIDIIEKIKPVFLSMKGEDFTIGLSASLNTNRVKAIPNIDLYKAFVANDANSTERTELLNLSSAHSDMIDNIYERISFANKNVAEGYKKFYDDYTDLLQEVMNERNKIVFSLLKNEYQGNITITEMNNLVAVVNKKLMAPFSTSLPEQRNDLAKLESLLINPLLEESVFKYIPKTIYSHDLLSIISKLKHNQDALLAFKTRTVAELELLISRLHFIRSSINETSSKLRK